MHAYKSSCLDKDLQVIGDLIPYIQASVIGRLVGNGKAVVDSGLIHAHAGCKLGEATIRLVAGLVDDVDVEVGLLVLEQRAAEDPVLLGRDLQHGSRSLVSERRGWVPGLDLLAEDELNVGSPCRVGTDQGRHDIVDGVELSGRVRADVVKEELQSVQGWGHGARGGGRGEGQLLTSEFRGEGHFRSGGEGNVSSLLFCCLDG